MPELSMDKINKHLLSSITDREFDVLRLIYEGNTNNQIAQQLFLSLNTVKVHLKNSYLKLDASSRTMAIARLREFITK